jgi:hypothetical protein
MDFAKATPAQHFETLTSAIHLHTETLKQSFILNVQNAPKLRTVFDFVVCCCGPTWAMASSSLSFLDHTIRRNIFGTTPLDGDQNR